MENRKNGKSKIWTYAIILFASAFVVLLFTAISQIKLNAHIEDYKSQLLTRDSENNQFKLNLNSALKENEKLSNQVLELEKQQEKIVSEMSQIKKELEEEKKNAALKEQSYEGLIKAEAYFDDKDYINCASLLKSGIDTELLGEEAKAKYSILYDKVMEKAAYALYKVGYDSFQKKQYAEAINSLSLSLSYIENAYYSDDCMYFLILSELEQGKVEDARMHLDQFRAKYPQSSFINKLEKTIKLN